MNQNFFEDNVPYLLFCMTRLSRQRVSIGRIFRIQKTRMTLRTSYLEGISKGEAILCRVSEEKWMIVHQQNLANVVSREANSCACARGVGGLVPSVVRNRSLLPG
ncbi:hypothetical protein TNIN_218991 [Trichonephila inaurata madagascariensis]|uniref:Uncharacterized protein n=1 Tax=Trichonephila inaurata madagascariensis TaxID=2747483 RepID=A0A8X6XGF7_9ARAC|nr:hypothetical protein TNIN_218991 [Trichonephila inaurata madagascariensis]